MFFPKVLGFWHFLGYLSSKEDKAIALRAIDIFGLLFVMRNAMDPGFIETKGKYPENGVKKGVKNGSKMGVF